MIRAFTFLEWLQAAFYKVKLISDVNCYCLELKA